MTKKLDELARVVDDKNPTFKVTTGLEVDGQDITIDQKADNNSKMTLLEAVQGGLAFLKGDVDNLIREALAENRVTIEKEVRAELVKKMQDEKLESRQKQATNYIEGTGLTDEEFAKKLIAMNVPQKCLSVLRDEHAKFLPKYPKKIWDYIRANYKEPKVK